MMKNYHIHFCLHFASINTTAWKKTRIFRSPLLVFTSWFFIFAEAFRNDHVAACGTALRSATEKNEMTRYLIIPCSSKTTLRSRTAA